MVRQVKTGLSSGGNWRQKGWAGAWCLSMLAARPKVEVTTVPQTSAREESILLPQLWDDAATVLAAAKSAGKIP